MKPYQGKITIEPGKRGGKPCIRGLRITVHQASEDNSPKEQTHEKMTESIQEEARNKKKIKRLSDVYAGLFH
jgi:uncharacterized protein (DUF433 family)